MLFRSLVRKKRMNFSIGNEEEGEEEGGGFTLGGDISFYEWDFERHMPSKQ